MTELLVKDEVSLKLPYAELTDDEFFDFCAANSDYRIERNAEGKIVVMWGTGGETGNLNADVSMQLHFWAKADRRGVDFDSSTLFRLPDGSMRSPDVAWVLKSWLLGLPKETRRRFLPVCPVFLIELTSPSDRLPEIQAKMRDWMANRCQLGWLLHVDGKAVHIYRPGREVEILEEPAQVFGEGPVAGFTLDLTAIWNPDWD